MRRTGLLALVALTGCATAHHNYSLDLGQVAEGMNCFGYATGKQLWACQWRLRGGVGELLEETLDEELHDTSRGYRAWFEIVALGYDSAHGQGRATATRVAYRFTLRDANDRELVTLDEKVIHPISHHRGRRYFSTLNPFFFEALAPVIERIRVAVARGVGPNG